MRENHLQNSQGKVFLGIHFYPGVAQYDEPGKESQRVFLNENTLRQMDSSFAGKPVFVQHVDEVEQSIDKLRSEADGWVIRSFYNAADGKHWAEFIVVSEKGLNAISRGMRLSNAYLPKQSKTGGLWNGVEYQQEITAGEYEHLAIVENPRYEESVILTPEEFKKYNAEKEFELKKLANSKDQPKGETKMGLNFFKRAKVENSIDLESTVVQLPKSKKELTIIEIVNELDKVYNMAGYASPDHMVKVGENEMSVGDLVKKHMEACNEMAKMKSAVSEEGGEPGKGADDEAMNSDESVSEDMKAVGDRGGDKSLSNAEEDEEEMKKKEAKKNEIKAKATALKNAGPRNEPEPVKVFMVSDKLALGKARYGSN